MTRKKLKAIRITGEVIGRGIAYKKRVSGIAQKHKDRMREFDPHDLFYIKIRKEHYSQSGYKVVTFNPERFEYYHREPSQAQLIAILKKEGKI